MSSYSNSFLRVARCEIVRTISLGKGQPLHPEQKREILDVRTDVRSTKREKRQWQREAKALGIGLSELVRAKMNRTTVKVAKVTDPALLAELRRQGLNLNQLVHAIQGGYHVAPERVEAVLRELQALYGWMLRNSA